MRRIPLIWAPDSAIRGNVRESEEAHMNHCRKFILRPAIALWMIGGIIAGSFTPNGEAQQSSPVADGGTNQASPAALPKDVYADSMFRLPLPKREDLDDRGKKIFDNIVSPNNPTLAGLRGPAGIMLNDPKLAELETALNQFLRYGSGLSGRFRELAILVTAREAHSQFEWAAHEPQALKEGLDQKTIDIVKYGISSKGLPEMDAVVIELGRQMFDQKKVDSETYASALKLFGPRGLVDLVALMGNYYGTAALLSTFDMQLRPGQKPLLP
jgi:4-carboxymuconolactone decarboxylase